ncbi:unnamed protein product [Prorocentrum cordatum]|uniref:Subtilisin n=1 Tax=Prorocentrum cordatum TaxID=2364126 RepID=A0ABN9R446_9DINO|nr:unnamed protein product [Polarella glacialis]
MLYVVGPKGQGAPGGGGPTVAGRGEFLDGVEAMAHNAVLAVAGYNDSEEVHRGALPVVEALQFCLVSGGVYRHPDASKLDVAAATVRGLRLGASEGPAGGSLPVVRFAYDEGVFERAVLADGSQ